MYFWGNNFEGAISKMHFLMKQFLKKYFLKMCFLREQFLKCNKKNLNKSFGKKIGKKINKRNWKKSKNKNKLKKIKKDEMNFLREQFFKKNLREKFFKGERRIWRRNFDADWDNWYFLNNYSRFTNLFTKMLKRFSGEKV